MVEFYPVDEVIELNLNIDEPPFVYDLKRVQKWWTFLNIKFKKENIICTG